MVFEHLLFVHCLTGSCVMYHMNIHFMRLGQIPGACQPLDLIAKAMTPGTLQSSAYEPLQGCFHGEVSAVRPCWAGSAQAGHP